MFTNAAYVGEDAAVELGDGDWKHLVDDGQEGWRDMADFAAMNEAYLEVIGADPPARITVGRAELAMGAAVEIDAIAARPSPTD